MSDHTVQIADQNVKAMDYEIRGIEGLSYADLTQVIAAGGRFVLYEYCISLIVVTVRRPSAVYLLRAGNKGLVRGLPYTILSLFLGWWGVPWGVLYTPLALLTNITGGCDVTDQVRAILKLRAEGTAPQPAV
jgi:hypothetical protein